MFQVTLSTSAPPSRLSFLESENAEEDTDVRRMTPKAYLSFKPTIRVGTLIPCLFFSQFHRNVPFVVQL